MSDLIVYAVEYIEVEFGQRAEGYKLYLFKDECIKGIHSSSDSGTYGGGGYYGPVRPLCYTEIPFDCIDEEFKHQLRVKHVCYTHNSWAPKFKGKTFYV